MIETIYTGKNLKEALTEASKTLDIPVQDIEYAILDEGKPGFLGLIGGKDTVIRVLVDEMEDVMRQRKERLAQEQAMKEAAEKKAAIEAKKAQEAQQAQQALQKEREEVKAEAKASATSQTKAVKQPLPVEKPVKTEEPKKKKPSEHPGVEVACEVNPQVEAGIRTFLNPILDQLVSHYHIAIHQEQDRVYVNILNDQNENFGILIGKRGVTLDALQYLVSIVANSHTDDYVKITLDTEDYRRKREEALIALANRMGTKALREQRRIALNPMNPFERRIIHVALQKMDGIATYSEGREPYRRVVIDVKS